MIIAGREIAIDNPPVKPIIIRAIIITTWLIIVSPVLNFDNANKTYGFTELEINTIRIVIIWCGLT